MHSKKKYSKRHYYTIEEIKQLAKERGGECLSNHFVKQSEKLKWKCSFGHEWEGNVNNFLRGAWCMRCAGYNNNICKRLDLEEAQRVALERGGKCLSKKYENNRTKLIWRCSSGHIWKACFDHVKMGTWCPTCKNGISQRYCQSIFEFLFDEKFLQTKPTWLINEKTDKKMELDGYNEKLKIAFEYNGFQHYRETHFSSGKKYTDLLQRDSLKAKLCKENGILLIVIPHTIKKEELSNYIYKKIVEGCVIPKNKLENGVVFETKYYDINIEKMKEMATNNGGFCLSKIYLGMLTKLTWKCKKGHIFKATPNNIKHGAWCPRCSGKMYSKNIIKKEQQTFE